MKKKYFLKFYIIYIIIYIMMNEEIIKEFERLVLFKKNQEPSNVKEKNEKMFSLRQLNNVLIILKKYPEKITIDNYNNIKEIDGIGLKTINRVKEILEKGYLEELADFEDTNKELVEKNKILKELESVIGIGTKIALDLYNNGITSIKMLKQKIKKNEIEVSDKVMLGLKYHGKYEIDIPRKEIDNINKIISKIVKKPYIYTICGSYRREKLTSGDIDILITIPDKKLVTDINHLAQIVEKLKENITSNDKQPLIVDDITDKNYETKYMGFLKYKKKPVRRVDIRYVPYESYFSALVYFTGSAELNKTMRTIAKEKGLKLSEYGLFNKDDTMLKVNSEEDVFKHLDMEYIEPKNR